MALSRCANCGFEYFETVKNKPYNSEEELTFVQCASCGYVIGVVNKNDTGLITKLLEENFSKAEKIATTIDHNIRLIAGKLGLKDAPPKIRK